MASLLLPVARLSFPSLFKPRKKSEKNPDEYYQATLLFPNDPAKVYASLGMSEAMIKKQADNLAAVEKAIAEKAIEYFGGKEKVPNGIKKKDLAPNSGYPFRDQAQKLDVDDDGEPLPSDVYEAGGMFLNMSSKRKPQVVDRRMRVLTDDTDLVYPGCWVIASTNAYGFKVEGNKGIGLGLNNVQWFAHGDRLGGGSSAQDDFGALDDGDEDETDTDVSADSLFD